MSQLMTQSDGESITVEGGDLISDGNQEFKYTAEYLLA